MDQGSTRPFNSAIPVTTPLSGGGSRGITAKNVKTVLNGRHTFLRGLSDQTRRLSQTFLDQRERTAHQLVAAARKLLCATTHRHLTDAELADTLGLTLLQARVTWRLAEQQLTPVTHRKGFLPPVDSVLGQLLRLALSVESLPSSLNGFRTTVAPILLSIDELVSRSSGPSEFDTLLQFHDRRGRARHGVYFTPRPLAAYIVNEIDRVLRSEFDLPLGLADTTTWSQVAASRQSVHETPAYGNLPFVTVLDPASGAGVFLIEVIERVYQTWESTPHARSLTDPERRAAWNEYVAHSLLPRLSGLDMLLPACAAGWLRIAEKLASTGYQFEADVPLPINLGDSLRGHLAGDPDSKGTDRAITSGPATVILGNPPFSALSTSSNPWIDGLLKSSSLHDRNVGGYYEADGKPLGEKKLWLHDDYVKFLRLAQWQIELAGCGVVGLITNHGYLDNLTFRGVRQSLLKTFSRISILDLHGNRKKREIAPQKKLDENVFGIDQGVAVGLFRRSIGQGLQSVNRADMWGSREEKAAILQDADRKLYWQTLSPHSPHYSFAPDRRDAFGSEYLRGFPLNEIMPVYSAAAVTARDRFAIAFSAEELLERLRVFSSHEISDVELRQRFFNRTRSSRYPAGDTRGWKLPVARDRARLVSEPNTLIQRCLYRPFDWRWILWSDWMIDWPRSDVMRHMLAQRNLALITRRQMLPDQPANYFYVADSIVLDGVIRSDNRGSESFFPLYLDDKENGSASPLVNFTDEFLQLCRQRTQDNQPVKPEDIFFMIYAQFHSLTYRVRYQAELCLGFPRVFVPRNCDLFRRLADYGSQLVEAHLLRQQQAGCLEKRLAAGLPDIEGAASTARDCQHFAQDELGIPEELCIHSIPSSTWEFHIGGYQVCRKWLRDRGKRKLSSEEVTQYLSIVDALTKTRRLMSSIESAISDAGGWPSAFL